MLVPHHSNLISNHNHNHNHHDYNHNHNHNHANLSACVDQGIGYDFIPRVLDRSIIDRWEKTRDQASRQ